MNETASILNNLSDGVLYFSMNRPRDDGISIAWAMVEYLHGNRQ
jgi:DNA mismatch repair ATPase MutS